MTKGFQYSNHVSFLLSATDEQTEKNSFEGEDEQEIENRIINSNIKLVETYKEMVKSDTMIQQIQKDNPQKNWSEILNALTVNSSINSQIFTVVVTTDSPEQSQKIARSIGKNFPKVVGKNHLPREVFVLATESTETSRSPSFSKLLIEALLLSFILSTFCSFIWDNLYKRKYIQNSETVQSLIGVEVIGVIDYY
ncbi:YveK family protein [Enterococcus alishanensis]